MDNRLELLRSIWHESENRFSVKHLLKYIEMFSTCSTSGGNCGMFSFGLAKYINDKYGTDIKLGMITNATEASTLDDLSFEEPDVYHVFLDWGGRYYDETGEIDADYLGELAEDQYGDYDPALWSDISLDKMILKIIRNDTNWKDSWQHFYNKLP